jgi:hypothetical protein
MSQEINVGLNRKVRPLRLAFMLDPSDRSQLLGALEINTILWGGRFNPMVPVYRRTPGQWEMKPFSRPTAKAILDGYLRAFDPDFVVDMTGRGICPDGYKSEGYRQKELLKPQDIVNLNDPDDPLSYGIDATEIYRHLYSKQFRFEQRDPVRVIIPEVKDPAMEAFSAACFGSFPTQKELAYFREEYLAAFKAATIRVEPGNFNEMFTHCLTPLGIGSAYINYGPRGAGRDDATLYYLDASDNLDIIDFWNLRAAGYRVLPIPKQWANGMTQTAADFVTRHNVPYRHNPAMMHMTTLQKGRSLTEDEIMRFHASLGLSKQGMVSIRTWYPQLWEDNAHRANFASPVEIYSDDDDVAVEYSGSMLTFKDKKPEFAEKWGGHGNARWANVFVFKSYGASIEHADVIPVRLPELHRALGSVGPGEIRSGKDGLVLLCRFSDLSHHWKPLASLSIFEAWARQNGYELSLSAAGKIARHLLQQLGGTWSAWIFADVEILRLIERMAHGTPISVGEMSSRLAHSIKGRLHQSGEKYLEVLIDRKLLRLGIELQCDHCQQRTWYALDQIKQELLCEKCLNAFPFPSQHPPPSPWFYKAAGALSIRDYCHGSYCVVLALRMLTRNMNMSATAIPSFVLKAKDGSELESDFGLFYRSGAWFDSDPYLIFGECKTFDRFTAKDVRRMRKLGQRFPGAVLVFCTLNDRLSESEKRLLRPLAKGGRKHLTGNKWLNPVLILTRTELFHDFEPEYAWQEAGGKYADFAKGHPRLDTLTELCDATQQLHLDMESYWKTVEEQRRKLMERRTKRLATQNKIT